MRCTEAPGLLTMHTIFMLEHNRLARELQLQPVMQEYLNKLPVQDQDEVVGQFPKDVVSVVQVVYQEARRLLAATFQAITYKEFLPLVLGEEIMKKYELEVKEGTDSSFDQSLDPTIWNEFATFAYRWRNQYLDLICRSGSATPWSPPSSRG